MATIRPGGTPGSIWVDSTDAGSRVAEKTGVHVRLASDDARTMTHLTITILYSRFPNGIRPASTFSGIPAQKTFELEAADAAVLERNLHLGGSIEVQRVRVLGITFTDGTKWTAETPNACSIKPKPYTLLNIAKR